MPSLQTIDALLALPQAKTPEKKDRASFLDSLLNTSKEKKGWEPEKGARSIEPSSETLQNKGIANLYRTAAGSVIGAIPDILSIPKHLIAAYKGEDGPETYSSKARKKIDELTGGYTKPENPEGGLQKGLEFGADFLTPGGVVAKTAKVLRGLSNTEKTRKSLRTIQKANELTGKNVATLAGGVAGANLAANHLLPEKREKDSWKNLVLPLAGGIAGGAATARATGRHFLPKQDKDALRVSKDIDSAKKWTNRLMVDLPKLARDQALGLEGTLGDYSARDFIKARELQLQRHPLAGRRLKNIYEQNQSMYNEHLGLSTPEFPHLEPTRGGELLQKAASKRKAHREAEHAREYAPINNAVKAHEVIPEDLTKGVVGSHIFGELKKASPSEQNARLKELNATQYLERFGNASKDLEHTLTDAQFAKKYLDDIKNPNKTLLTKLEEGIGPITYYSNKSIKDSLGETLHKAFGLLGDKKKGADKRLWVQLKKVEDSYLKENHPALYVEKKKLDSKYAGFRREEAPIINDLLGSTEKPMTPVDAFTKASNMIERNPKYVTHAQELLNPTEKQTLSQVFLKDKARRDVHGDVTAPAIATAFSKLEPSTKEIILNGFSPEQQRTFVSSVESILDKKGLTAALANSSGTHYHAALDAVAKVVSDIASDVIKLHPIEATRKGVRELGAPVLQAKFLTNQARLKKYNMLNNPAMYEKEVAHANKVKESTNLKSSLKNTALKAASLSNILSHIR